VKYRIESDFACDCDTLIQVMFSKGISEKLLPLMKDMQEAETLAHEEQGGRITRRVRYRPVPMIKSLGPKKVDPRWMEFVEESEVEIRARKATYQNVPTTPGVARLLKNRGEIEFVPLGPGRSRRILSGELRIDFPVLGAIAERLIIGHAKRLVEAEAAALSSFIDGGGR